jgi:hypothetical protein
LDKVVKVPLLILPEPTLSSQDGTNSNFTLAFAFAFASRHAMARFVAIPAL